jgi:hypothetical protein
LSDAVVAAGNDVGLEHVVIAEDVLLSADQDERAKSPAAAKAVGEIEAPPAGGAELDGRCLFRGVTNAAARLGHGAEFFGELDLHADSTEGARQIANHFAYVACVLIDVNNEGGFASRIEADRSTKHLGLAHPICGDFMLHGHNGSDVGVGFIEHAGWRSCERGEGNKSGENSGR